MNKDKLISHAVEDAVKLDPFTLEEIDAMMDQSELDLKDGRVRDIEDLFREWDGDENMGHVAEVGAEYTVRRV